MCSRLLIPCTLQCNIVRLLFRCKKCLCLTDNNLQHLRQYFNKLAALIQVLAF